MATTKRKRVDPAAVRKANREAATKEELIQALVTLDKTDRTDMEKLHQAGVHRFFVEQMCQGNTEDDRCFVQCNWCYAEDCAVENTEPDEEEDDGSRICFECLDKAERMRERKRQRQS